MSAECTRVHSFEGRQHHGMGLSAGWLAAAALLGVAPALSQAAHDRCPAPDLRPDIEVVTSKTFDGNTCALTDDLSAYAGSCGIPNVDYSGPDAIYKVRLHKGNSVSFQVESPEGADFVLALLRDECGNSERCFVSTFDPVGPEAEKLSERSYPPGTYYLYIDSAKDANPNCGSYALSFEGTNPTPDLRVSLTAPSQVVAGTEFTYLLEVENEGTLDATGLRAEVTLSKQASLVDPGVCTKVSPHHAVCEVASLARGATLERELKVRVESSEREVIKANAKAHAVEGGQDMSQCEGRPSDPRHCASTTTSVRAETDLALRRISLPGIDDLRAVAGCSLVHKLVVSNDGPSDATGVEVKVRIPEELDLVGDGDPPKTRGCAVVPSCPEGSVTECQESEGEGIGQGTEDHAVCHVGQLKHDTERLVCLRMTLDRSAAGILPSRAEVGGAKGETDPDLSDNQVPLRITVDRKTDLAIRKLAIPVRAVAGKHLDYEIHVRNLGPSDSSGGTVCDALPPEVELVEPAAGCCTSADPACPIAPIARCRERFPDVAPSRLVACVLGAIPQEGVRAKLGVKVAPSAGGGPSPPEFLVNVAEVLANEVEPELQGAKDNNRTEWQTELVARADLEPELDVPASVVAGRFVVHRLRVRNQGPSDSPGGMVEVVAEARDADSLALGRQIEFVGSPDGCSAHGDSFPLAVQCPLGQIPVGESRERRFGLRIASSASGTLETTATVLGEVKDPRSRNNQAFVTKSIEIEADLAVQQTADPDPVPAEGELTYEVEVTNLGPSDATGVVLCDYLPQGVELSDRSPEQCPGISPCCPPTDEASGQVLELPVGTLSAGQDGVAKVEIQVRAPFTHGAIRNLVRAVAGDPGSDPEQRNNESAAATTVVGPGDLDLALSLVGSTDPVAPGGQLEYRLTVNHRGPSGASVDGLKVKTELPDGVDLQSTQGADCDDGTEQDDGSRVVVCTLDTLEVGVPRELQLVVRVGRQLTSTLGVTSQLVEQHADDPDVENDSARVVTRVLGDLALPFFESGAPPSGSTTLFAVRNDEMGPAVGGPNVRIEVRSTHGVEELVELCELPERAVLTARLGVAEPAVCDRTGSPIEVGSLEVRRLGAESGSEAQALLSGDAFRVAGSLASGNRLVRTAPSTVPFELCKRWATRFLNGGAFDGGTDFVFWLPRGAGAAAQTAAVQGKVYDETGQEIQTVAIETGEEAFVRSSLEVFDLPEASGRQAGFLKVQFGAVEWSLPRAGHVSVVHRAEGRFSIAVPGFCLDAPETPAGGDRPVRRDTLVLPYFEVDRNAEGRTTLFAVRNEGLDPVELSVDYFDQNGDDAFGGVASKTVGLQPREIRTFNLREPARASGIPVSTTNEADFAGFVRIQPTTGFGEVLLSGDYFRVHPAAGQAAGEALVKADPADSSTQLCHLWATRLIAGGDFGGTTEFVYFAPSSTGASGSPLEGSVYNESGEFQQLISFPTGDIAFDLEVGPDIDELGIDPTVRFGSIEWQLLDGLGHVSTLFRTTGGHSVLIPGTCLER